ncbi:LysR family transcriptional regulator [soil metagenome]
MNIRNFDLNLLRVFMALHEEKNVSRAAVAIGLSQPAVSNALLRLRRACDDPLFVRTTGGMEPTALAEQMAPVVKRGLAVLDEGLDRPMGFEPQRSSRTFRVLMSDVGEGVVLPRLMAVLLREAPGMQVEALQIAHADYAAALESGKADLAIGNLPFLKAGFYQQRVFVDHYVCIADEARGFGAVTPKGSSKTQPAFGWTEYLASPHVYISSGNAEDAIDNLLLRRRRSRIVKLKVAHYHVAAAIVKETGMLATVPRNAVLDAKGLSLLPLPFKLASAEVRQFWHRRAHLDPGNQWLRATIAGLGLQAGSDQ